MSVSLLQQARERLVLARNEVNASIAELDAAISAMSVKLPDDLVIPEMPQEPPSLIAPMGGLRSEAAFKTFFDHVRGRLWPKLLGDQVKGCEAILRAGAGVLPVAWMAYALATTYHETEYTMQPVHEKGSNAYLSKYDTGKLAAALGNTPEADGDGQRLAGRGYVQLTGATNYKRATAELRKLGVLKSDEDLFVTPDLAMRPDIAAAILVYGMRDGWFTGKSLRTYLPARATRAQFAAARRIINGMDKADQIAGYALVFQEALIAAGWE